MLLSGHKMFFLLISIVFSFLSCKTAETVQNMKHVNLAQVLYFAQFLRLYQQNKSIMSRADRLLDHILNKKVKEIVFEGL